MNDTELFFVELIGDSVQRRSTSKMGKMLMIFTNKKSVCSVCMCKVTRTNKHKNKDSRYNQDNNNIVKLLTFHFSSIPTCNTATLEIEL